MKFAVIFALFLYLSSSEVTVFSDLAMARIYQFHLDALIFFQGDEQLEASSQEELKKYATTSPDLSIILLSKNQDQQAFTKVSNFYGINVSKTPQILYLSNQKKKYALYSDIITADIIASFISSIKDGLILPYYKSQPLPLSNEQRIIKVVGKSFKEIVLDTDKQILMYFYGPKCGHCINFNPHFQQIAQKLANNSNIILAKFDATMNEFPGVQIQTLPTVIFWRKDKQFSLKYTGKHKYEQLLEWLEQSTEYPWISAEQSVDETL